jgi:hypothetical protein
MLRAVGCFLWVGIPALTAVVYGMIWAHAWEEDHRTLLVVATLCVAAMAGQTVRALLDVITGRCP